MVIIRPWKKADSRRKFRIHRKTTKPIQKGPATRFKDSTPTKVPTKQGTPKYYKSPRNGNVKSRTHFYRPTTRGTRRVRKQPSQQQNRGTKGALWWRRGRLQQYTTRNRSLYRNHTKDRHFRKPSHNYARHELYEHNTKCSTNPTKILPRLQPTRHKYPIRHQYHKLSYRTRHRHNQYHKQLSNQNKRYIYRNYFYHHKTSKQRPTTISKYDFRHTSRRTKPYIQPHEQTNKMPLPRPRHHQYNRHPRYDEAIPRQRPPTSPLQPSTKHRMHHKRTPTHQTTQSHP